MIASAITLMVRKTVRSSIIILAVSLTTAVLAAVVPGCDSLSKIIPTGNRDAFIYDRVVEVRITMSPEDWAFMQKNATRKPYVMADMRFDGELVSGVAVRPKGASSLQSVYELGSPRFSLTVDFNLLDSERSFRGLKKLNFDDGFLDPSYVRERLASELFQQMGVPAPRESHVNLWVNNDHLGVYTQVEEIDKAFLKKNYKQDGGNLYRGAGPLNWNKEQLAAIRSILTAEKLAASADNVTVRENLLAALQQQEPRISHNQTSPLQRPDWWLDDLLLGLDTNKKHPNHTALFKLVDVICNEPDQTFPQEIEKVLDVDEVLRYLAVYEVDPISRTV